MFASFIHPKCFRHPNVYLSMQSTTEVTVPPKSTVKNGRQAELEREQKCKEVT